MVFNTVQLEQWDMILMMMNWAVDVDWLDNHGTMNK